MKYVLLHTNDPRFIAIAYMDQGLAEELLRAGNKIKEAFELSTFQYAVFNIGGIQFHKRRYNEKEVLGEDRYGDYRDNGSIQISHEEVEKVAWIRVEMDFFFARMDKDGVTWKINFFNSETTLTGEVPWAWIEEAAR